MTSDPPPPAREHGAGAPTLPRRWVGTLFCRTPGCETVLAEVMADMQNMTYLQPIGGLPKRTDAIPCPRCGRVRVFRSGDVGPPPSPLVVSGPKLVV